MNKKSLSLYDRVRALFVKALLMAALLTSSYTTFPWQQQGTSPTLVLEAPAQVELGDLIEIQVIVDHVHDIGGYEAQLLFDTSAAHFSGLHQQNSDIKKFGRDVIPLEATELPDGVAMGLASCPYRDCVERSGNSQLQGANGRVRLGTVLVGTDQEGLLELSFEHLKFVDSTGNVIAVDVPQTRIHVQVGQENGARFPAPASNWIWAPSPGTAGSFDITADGVVNYEDAIEGAFEWKLSREQGQSCGLTNDLRRDVNGDGCIDVADIQTILGNTSGDHLTAQGEPQGTADAQRGPLTPLTFIVNSRADTADSNPFDGVCASSSGCTLRAAIMEANSHSGPDTILFNIPGSGVQTIQLNSRLPSLSDGSGGTTIDGYSQLGARANTASLVSNAVIMIQIRGNGPGPFDAFAILSAGNVIRGLSIFNAHRGIFLYGSGARNNLIIGNFIGTDAAGTFGHTVHTLHASGVDLDMGANNNQVGGPSPADRNVISGNARHGINFNSEGTDSNRVYNNLIGTNPSGTGRLQNMRHGIDINSGPSYNLIGGTEPGQRNILSGNGEAQNEAFTAGVEISHDELTSFNSVIGNCIGTEPSCNTAPFWALNRHYGIRLEDRVNNNTVAHNVIGNSPQGGIRITGSNTNRNLISGNRVGISLNGTAIPNPQFAIQIDRYSKFNRIGPGNIIANSPYGVQVLGSGTDGHTITQNLIFNIPNLGIDLDPVAGVSPNDNRDTDAGANEGLNWPVLSRATTSQVTGTACAEAIVPKPCTIEIFIAERRTSDSGGGNYGQAKVFVGSGTTGANGSFTVTVSGITAGQYLTATATDAAGNTSEFSRNLQVSSGQPSGAVHSITTGVFRPSNGALFLRNANASGFADVQIHYGMPGDYPVVGDWNGDGMDTIGVYRNGQFYLRNSNTSGFADIVFPFGAPGDQPIAGDWNRDGVDTIGIYRSGTFFLRNTNTAGSPDRVFGLGVPGDVGIAGDWNGDGIDTTGVFRPSNGALYLKNSNTTGFADLQINYGLPGDKPVTGDWNDDGVDTIGVYRNGMFLLRNSNTIGFAEIVFALGSPGDHPIAGDWDNLP